MVPEIEKAREEIQAPKVKFANFIGNCYTKHRSINLVLRKTDIFKLIYFSIVNNEPNLCLCIRPRKNGYKDRQHYAYVLTSTELDELKEKRDTERAMVIQEINEIEQLKIRENIAKSKEKENSEKSCN